MKNPILFFALFVFSSPIFSQEVSLALAPDSLKVYNLDEVEVLSKKFHTIEERREFERLKHHTLKVYPYVLMAEQIYDELILEVSDAKRRSRKKYVNEMEKELRERFEHEIRNLTKTQGNILIKLINRNTGNNCFEIVKELKGGFTAFWWNVGGKIYNHNLKEDYNPEENADLELIIRMIENGQLQVRALQ